MSRQEMEQELAQNKADQDDLGKRVRSCIARATTPSDPHAYTKSADYRVHSREDNQLLHEALALEKQLKELGPRTLTERWQGCYFLYRKRRQEHPGNGARQRDVEEGLKRHLLDSSSK